MVLKGTLVLLLCRKEPFYSRVPEYQAAHLGFFVFIMEFPTLFSMQELSEKSIITSQLRPLRLTTACQLTELWAVRGQGWGLPCQDWKHFTANKRVAWIQSYSLGEGPNSPSSDVKDIKPWICKYVYNYTTTIPSVFPWEKTNIYQDANLHFIYEILRRQFRNIQITSILLECYILL